MKFTGVRSVFVIASSRFSRRVRFVDPVAARIRAIKDDFEDAALLFPLLGRQRTSLVEFLEQNLHDALELTLLGWRQMVDLGPHLLLVPCSSRRTRVRLRSKRATSTLKA